MISKRHAFIKQKWIYKNRCIRLGHSLSYRQENAMTWTVSFHFPSNNVVLLSRNYSNKLQPIYNNSLTLNVFTPKNNKNKSTANIADILCGIFPQLQIPLVQNDVKHSGVFYPELTAKWLLEAAREGWTDESYFSLVVFVFLWLWESMNGLVLLFVQRSLSFCRSQKRAVFIQQTRCKWAIQLFVKAILPL